MTVLRRKKRRSFSTKARIKDKPLKRFSRNVLLAVNIVLVIMLILAYLSVFIHPSSTAIPALFGLAFQYIAAANIVMIIIWILFRRWYALISVVAIAVGFGYIYNLKTST